MSIVNVWGTIIREYNFIRLGNLLTKMPISETEQI